MFFGSHAHSLDDKGRFILPAKFRDAVNLEEEGHKFIMTRGLRNSIFVFPPSEFRRFMKKVRRSGAFTKHRDFKMQFLAYASDQSIDSQGRISVPSNLREMAGIEKEVWVIGADNWIEVWARDRWDQFVEASEDQGTYDQHAEALFEGLDESEDDE